MAGICPDVGEVEVLKRALNYSATGDVILRLYVNDKTPVEDDVVTNYTECSTAGYSPKTLTGSSWTIATNAGVTTAEYPQQTFSLTASATIYGYYITDLAGTILLFAERFSDGPYTIPSGGGDVKVTPKMSLD